MENTTEHSVSWTREASTPHLAGIALDADAQVQEELDSERLARAREMRRIALDELVRRGAIEPYSFV